MWPADGGYGFTASLEPDPEKMGQRGTLTEMGIPCGFTCTFAITWPSGQVQNFPSHTVRNGDKGRVSWSWTVPQMSTGGRAATFGGCTSPSHPLEPSGGYFTIVSPPTPPPAPSPSPNWTWTLQATADSPVSAADGNVTFHITVAGLGPGQSAEGCSITISPASEPGGGQTPFYGAGFGNGTQDVTVHYQNGPVGTWDWGVSCSSPSVKFATGTVQAE